MHTYIPRPPLSDFIECFWLQEGGAKPVKERALPTGTLELVINLREECLDMFGQRETDHAKHFDSTLLCGPHSEFFVIDSKPDELILGVHFKPGGAVPFLNVSPAELHNTHASLETLWGARAAALRDEVLQAATPTERFRRLESFLLWEAHRPLEQHPVVAFALHAFQSVPHTRTIATVADQTGLSHRQFIQVFRDRVGLTPKQFCRIRRFQEVLHATEHGYPDGWADLALVCGYYDQAHFNRDFRAFAGITPTDYLRDRGERLNHVPIAD